MAGRGAARGGRATDTTTPPPLTLQQVAAMLERATVAVRTATHPLTAEAVGRLSDAELRRDPVLAAAFDRGWSACAAAVNRTTRNHDYDGGAPKRSKPTTKPATSTSAATKRPAVRQSSNNKPATPNLPQPSTSRTGGIPPLPSSWSEAERNRVLTFNPNANPYPANTLRSGHRPTTRGSSSSSPGNRTTCAPKTLGETSQKEVKETARDRNHKRFLALLDRKKARKAKASSQQHRLAKHPVTDDRPTATPEVPPTVPEAMEVDPQEPGTSASPGQPAETPTETSSRDATEVITAIDIYLDALTSPPDNREESPPAE